MSVNFFVSVNIEDIHIESLDISLIPKSALKPSFYRK